MELNFGMKSRLTKVNLDGRKYFFVRIRTLDFKKGLDKFLKTVVVEPLCGYTGGCRAAIEQLIAHGSRPIGMYNVKVILNKYHA